MVNEERVKLMTKMAAYESKEGKDDFRISSYYRNDYTSFNALITIIWATIGYIILVAGIVVLSMDKLMNNLTMERAITIAVAIVGAYLVLIVIYGVIAGSIYHDRYNRAKQRVKKYYRHIARLNKLYEKEKR
ncbi:MAG: hypothetical protein PHX08_00720 [Lachnospiraceae bacterium]|nr:hypothetical protein [Lachnospiraceae bacterium]